VTRKIANEYQGRAWKGRAEGMNRGKGRTGRGNTLKGEVKNLQSFETRATRPLYDNKFSFEERKLQEQKLFIDYLIALQKNANGWVSSSYAYSPYDVENTCRFLVEWMNDLVDM